MAAGKVSLTIVENKGLYLCAKLIPDYHFCFFSVDKETHSFRACLRAFLISMNWFWLKTVN